MTGRSLIRVLRWAALAAVAPALWACTARSLEKPMLTPESTFGKTFQQTVNRNLDLLFMVDNSSSMRLSQTNLLNNFPTFMTTLQSSPAGLPNIHVAVVSSDMGAGDGSIAGCDNDSMGTNPGGNRGVFQFQSRNPTGVDCTTNALNANQTFISNVGGQANYTGDLAKTFTCIAALGETGCGFEHQFASIMRALGADGRDPPAENQGFLRPEAYLGVILITNEDDCSGAPNVPLFDTGSNRDMGSQLGPPANFRCNEFGHTCPTGVSGDFMRSAPHPDRNAPNQDVNQTVMYDGCASDDTEGFLWGTHDVAERIKKVKLDSSQVLVAAITGAPTPYVVHWKTPSNPDMSCGAASCPWPEISHVCTATDGSFADPGVRVAQFVSEFGANGLRMSICENSFGPSLDQIAQLINARLQPPCITQTIQPDANGDPTCIVTGHATTNGNTVDTTIPYCPTAPAGTLPCWRLRAPMAGETCGGQILQVDIDMNASTATSQNATVNCLLQ